MSIDSKNDLFKQLTATQIPNLIERSQYNKRPRNLFQFTENIRTFLAASFLEFENYFIIDSLPLEICKKTQQNRIKIANIVLETPMRINQKGCKKQLYIFRKSCKRIETLFSQLCDQSKIRNNYAKTFEGFKTRILGKITALTLVQYINKFIFDRPINNIKIQINYLHPTG